MEAGALIPADLDEDIWTHVPEDRAAEVAVGFRRSGAKSHVLLAACSEGQTAREVGKSGIFTQALLVALRKNAKAMAALTYRELLREVQIPAISRYILIVKSILYVQLTRVVSQTPQCEGHNRDRVLFYALAPGKGPVVYRVTHQSGTFTMSAGEIHGVTLKAQFSIHKDPREDTPSLAVMEAECVKSFSSELMPVSTFDTQPLPSPCFAFQIPALGAALGLRINQPVSGCAVFEALRTEIGLGTAGYSAVIVDEGEAHIALTLDGNRVQYSICYDEIRRNGLCSLWLTTKAETVYVHHVLRAASHFFWHLRREPKLHQLRDKVNIEVYKLRLDKAGELDDYLRAPFVPETDGGNLLCRHQQDVVLDVVADNHTVYGIAIKNTSKGALHVWAFYFDCSDLSIGEPSARPR